MAIISLFRPTAGLFGPNFGRIDIAKAILYSRNILSQKYGTRCFSRKYAGFVLLDFPGLAREFVCEAVMLQLVLPDLHCILCLVESSATARLSDASCHAQCCVAIFLSSFARKSRRGGLGNCINISFLQTKVTRLVFIAEPVELSDSSPQEFGMQH